MSDSEGTCLANPSSAGACSFDSRPYGPVAEKSALIVRFDTGSDPGIFKVRKMLLAHGFDDSDIYILCYKLEPLLDQRVRDPRYDPPTAARFKKRFEWMVKGAEPGHVICLYVDLHGSPSMEYSADPNEPGGYDEGWKFAEDDAGIRMEAISDNYITETLKFLNPMVNLTILTSSCRGSGMLDIHNFVPGILMSACYENQTNTKSYPRTAGPDSTILPSTKIFKRDVWTFALLQQLGDGRKPPNRLTYMELFIQTNTRILAMMDNYEVGSKYLGPSPNLHNGPRGPDETSTDSNQDPQIIYCEAYIDPSKVNFLEPLIKYM